METNYTYSDSFINEKGAMKDNNKSCMILLNRKPVAQTLSNSLKEAQVLADSISKKLNMHDEMLKALQKAIAISDLWTFDKNSTVEHEDEARALHSMKFEFERIINKALGNE